MIFSTRVGGRNYVSTECYILLDAGCVMYLFGVIRIHLRVVYRSGLIIFSE